MTRLKIYHLHPLLFAIFPLLSLFQHNIEEVDIGVAIRPFWISLFAMLLIFLCALLLLKSWDKAALVTSFLLVMILSYGHVYNAIRSIPEYGISLGRHRYLIVLYGLVTMAGLWWIVKRLRDLRQINQFCSLIGLVLMILPVAQVLSHARKVSIAESLDIDYEMLAEPLNVAEDEELPDIYYIILDTYTRADCLLKNYDYDNSSFLNDLQEMGFYVANRSRCNHCYTQGSLVSSLNMNYMGALAAILEENGIGDDIWVLLKHSIVRESLEQIGYQTIAFDTGFEWSRIRDADTYLAFDKDPLFFQTIDPFETLFIKSTVGRIWIDWQYKSTMNANNPLFESVGSLNFPYEGYAKRQLSILQQLPQLATLPGPKFIFAHVLIPHVPRVFTPQGEIQSDPGYYSGELDGPIDDVYDKLGYVSEIEFINNRMLEILPEIIENSSLPPIIVLQGDTGSRYDLTEILNAYYLRGEQPGALYESISPVNTFRLIFDTYFGSGYGFLEDVTYDNSMQILDASPACTW
jgi:hypothetical protein